MFDNISDSDIMESTFCDDYSQDNDLYLANIINRKDRKPLYDVPLTIKTHLLRTDISEALQTLEEISDAFSCAPKDHLSEEELENVAFKNNLDEVFGIGCAQKIYQLYSEGAVRFNDLVGYDIYTRLCQYKVQYVDWEQLRKESERFSCNTKVQQIPNLNVSFEGALSDDMATN